MNSASRSRLSALAFAAGLAGLGGLLLAGLVRSFAVDGGPPGLTFSYGGHIADLAEREEWPELVRELRIAAAIDLADPAARDMAAPALIRVARSIGDRESELAGWRHLARWNPDSPGAQSRLAAALLSAPEVPERDRREAERAGRRALELAPQSAFARFQLGHVAWLEGRRAEAFAFFRDAEGIDPARVEQLLQRLEAREPGVTAAYREAQTAGEAP